jgi:hypothetical protein
MDNRDSVTIESSEEAQPSPEAQVPEQPVIADAPAETQAEASEPVDLDLSVKETPSKTVDEFFEQDYGRIMDSVVANGGQFTDELYAEFEANGHSRAVADRLLEAEVAKATLRTQQVVNSVGGQDVAMKALEWAAANLNEGQKAAVNAQLQNTDPDVSTMALRSLIAQSGAANTTVSADSGLVNSSGYFENDGDFQDAIRDNRRMNDPTYRQSVMQKLQRSMEMGLINPDQR